MLGLNETIDQLAMTSSVSWNGHVLRREDGNVLRRVLDLEANEMMKAMKAMNGRASSLVLTSLS